MRLVLTQRFHDMPITITPTINRLFYISHYKNRIAYIGQYIPQQLTNNAPLKRTRILKLINQHMLKADTHFLQYKVRVSLLKRLA